MPSGPVFSVEEEQALRLAESLENAEVAETQMDPAPVKGDDSDSETLDINSVLHGDPTDQLKQSTHEQIEQLINDPEQALKDENFMKEAITNENLAEQIACAHRVAARQEKGLRPHQLEIAAKIPKQTSRQGMKEAAAKLHYVDLFGCPEVDAFSCFVASSDQVQLVWPSVEQLLTFAQRAAVPEQRTLELLEAAVKALVRNAAREAAATATLEIGVRELRPPKVVRSIFPEVMTDTEEDDEKSEALSESEPEKVPEPRGKVGECIRPWAFVRKLKADGFKPGTALQGTRLFRVLDEDDQTRWSQEKR
eukprot:g12189.t1